LIEYSPIAALNRTYALSRARNKKVALLEAEKLKLGKNHLYHALLGDLYKDLDQNKAIEHLEMAMALAKSAADRATIQKTILELNNLKSKQLLIN